MQLFISCPFLRHPPPFSHFSPSSLCHSTLFYVNYSTNVASGTFMYSNVGKGCMGCRRVQVGADGPLPQTTHSTTTTLDAIRTYVRLFKRAHLVPGRPLSQLSWNHPVVLHGWTQYTTIQVLQSRFNIKLGDGGGFTAETILLVFTTPATVFQLPVICGIHIPIFMWYNGVTQRQGPEFLSDPREPGFQIGAREVREAIRSHLLARWCDLHQPMPRPPRSSLFGQVLVREYVSVRLILPMRRAILSRLAK